MNDADAAKLTGISHEYVPQLPIEAAKPDNEPGAYIPIPAKKGQYANGIFLARNTDYFNPAHLYARTGPENLEPMAGSAPRVRAIK